MSLQRDYDSLECSTLLATDIDASVVATFREVVSEASGFGQIECAVEWGQKGQRPHKGHELGLVACAERPACERVARLSVASLLNVYDAGLL